MLTINDIQQDALAILNAAPDNYLILLPDAPQFTIVGVTDSYLKATYTRREDILGKGLFEVFPDNPNLKKATGVQNLSASLYYVLENKQEHRMADQRYDVPNPGGGEFVYKVWRPLNRPVFNDAGEVQYIIHNVKDVTEIFDEVAVRKKIEESHREIQFIMDTVPQIIWLTRPDGYHYFFNKRWYEFTGLTYEETKGDKWNYVFHPDDRERTWERWRHSLATGEPYEIEYRCRRYDGEYRWLLGRALPLKNEKGNIIKWFGTCTDIHDQKLFAEVLEKLVDERTKELHQINEDLQQFVHVSSHDLKEPVRKISVFVNRMAEELGEQLNDKSKFYLDRLQVTARRMSSMIDGVLTFSTINTWEEKYELVDLNEVIKNVEFDLELALQQKEAVISFSNLPKLEGSRVMLQQVFYNLISNSLKFAKINEPPVINITSEIIHQKRKLFARILVQDNGIGFEQKFAEKIFASFIRLHPKDKYEGAGLGLSLCKKIIERHGGSIAAKGEQNKGTVFEILLPVKDKLR